MSAAVFELGDQLLHYRPHVAGAGRRGYTPILLLDALEQFLECGESDVADRLRTAMTEEVVRPGSRPAALFIHGSVLINRSDQYASATR
jgi:hypothetical protein